MIRNFLFSILFFTGIIFISIIFLPSFFLPKQVVLMGGKLMGHWASFCLRFVLSVKISIKGKENIINNEKFFIAASHQSMFETFYLQTIFNSPVFILKKELLLIFDDISKMMATSNRPLIIFPQGTRVLPDERPPFKKGASRIYEQLNVACQPVAINSGYVWPKKGKKKSNKTITISILKPIPSGLTKENFIQILEKNIYSELDLIN
jgi:1-acyl-sn-glycerol-3-phosphate acyltransferase